MLYRAFLFLLVQRYGHSSKDTLYRQYCQSFGFIRRFVFCNLVSFIPCSRCKGTTLSYSMQGFSCAQKWFVKLFYTLVYDCLTPWVKNSEGCNPNDCSPRKSYVGYLGVRTAELVTIRCAISDKFGSFNYHSIISNRAHEINSSSLECLGVLALRKVI